MLKRYGVGGRDVWRSILFGGIVGLVGVIVFVLFLKYPIEKETVDVVAPVEDDVTVAPAEAVTFYALQHDVYTSEEGARDFLASQPTLVNAIAMPVEGRYYVWSKIARENAGITKVGTSFVKKFELDGSACKKESLRSLPKYLATKNEEKFNFGEDIVKGALPEDWAAISATAVKISDDMDIVRMHLISHYFSSQDCLKITFN